MFFSGKLNKLRTVALSLVFFGILVMYIGYVGFTGFLGSYIEHIGMIFLAIFLVIGFLFVIGSSVMYMWLGMVSTKAERVFCPSCGKATKVLGTTDQCMFCNQTLTFDPNYAPDSQNVGDPN